MPEYSDEVIRASLEATGASLADYILFATGKGLTICVVGQKGLLGAIADDDDARFQGSIAYLAKMKVPYCTTIEELETHAARIIRNREKNA